MNEMAMNKTEGVPVSSATHDHHVESVPLMGNAKVPFITRGVVVLMVLAAAGLGVLAWRLAFGVGSVTNLNTNYPWGLWIGIDVATGVALAAGGFTTSFLAHILHKDKYEAVVRPALLTAMFGYTFVGLGVAIDLGRYYNIWHIFVPSMWQGNSALFEVGWCVSMYVTVLYIEFLPIVCERFKNRVNLPGPMKILNAPLNLYLRLADRFLDKTITIFLMLGVVLSCAHQSSLGTLMVIAPTKLHPLWHTQIMPLQFLLSAFAVGLSMVIFEAYLASRSFKREFELDVLAPLGRLIPFLLTAYFGSKLIDMVNRGTYVYLDDGSLQSISWLVEVIGGVFIPAFIFMTHRLRRQPKWLFTAAAMVVFGVALNRINVFIIGFQPQFGDGPYIPAIPEILLTVGFISILVLLYRAWVWVFPVLPREEGEHHA